MTTTDELLDGFLDALEGYEDTEMTEPMELAEAALTVEKEFLAAAKRTDDEEASLREKLTALRREKAALHNTGHPEVDAKRRTARKKIEVEIALVYQTLKEIETERKGVAHFSGAKASEPAVKGVEPPKADLFQPGRRRVRMSPGSLAAAPRDLKKVLAERQEARRRDGST